MNTFKHLEKKITNAQDLEFNSLLNNVIKLFKEVWLKGFLTILLIIGTTVGVNTLFTLIGLAPKPAFNTFDLDLLFDTYSKTLIYNIPQTILITTMAMAFIAAFYKICKQHLLEEDAANDYFYFLKEGYFSKLLMLGIIHTVIAITAQLLFIIPYFYAFVPLAYFTIIFANNPHLSEAEIVKASFKLAHKKWLITFGAMFVTGCLAILGIIAFFIGIFVTMSIVYLPVFFIYKDVIGFKEDNSIEQTHINQ